jgi:hypothetical protein
MAQRFEREDDDGLLSGHACLVASHDSLPEIRKVLGQPPVVEQAVAADDPAAEELE